MRLSKEIELLVSSNELLAEVNGMSRHIKLENQLMQIMLLLGESKNNTVEKKSFIERIWQGNELTGDAALTKNIFKLREVLKANGLEEKLNIETIPKKGYRLMVTEQVVKRPKFTKPVLITMAIVVCVMALFSFPGIFTSRKIPQPVTTIIGKDTIIQLSNTPVTKIIADTGDTVIYLNK